MIKIKNLSVFTIILLLLSVGCGASNSPAYLEKQADYSSVDSNNTTWATLDHKTYWGTQTLKKTKHTMQCKDNDKLWLTPPGPGLCNCLDSKYEAIIGLNTKPNKNFPTDSSFICECVSDDPSLLFAISMIIYCLGDPFD